MHCALDINEYNLVSTCQTAKEIWDKLEVTCEEMDQMKESKANIFVQDYELFEMKLGETIAEMNTRFTNLVNVLMILEKDFKKLNL